MAQPSRRWIWIATGVVVLGAAAWMWMGRQKSDFKLMTGDVTRGPLNAIVSATGTVNPVVTVHVGSQVSGTVARLYADFNTHVEKGQLLAQLDPAIYQAQVDQAVANLEKARVSVQDAKRTLDRANEMFKKDFIAKVEVQAAETSYLSMIASQKQAAAAVNLARVNVTHCTIRSPIAGIVISRSVDVGQTVAASLSAPELFVIANDLSHMQVETAIDEADVGKVAMSQPVTFTVDAFQDRTFRGTVREVRSLATTLQNVVTYTTVIDVANPDSKLLPGMTANVSILVAHRDDALRVPNAALRFRPPDDVIKKLGLKESDVQVTPGAMGGGARTAAGAGSGSGAMAATNSGGGGRSDSARAAWRRGGGGAGGRGAQGGGEGSDSSRARWRREGGGASGEIAGWGGGGRGRGARSGGRVFVETTPNHLKPVQVKTGLSDAQFTEITEVTEGELAEGQKVATAVIQTGQPTAQTTTPPGFGGGGGGGGGGRGGGGRGGR